jgi:hypothetical protein
MLAVLFMSVTVIVYLRGFILNSFDKLVLRIKMHKVHPVPGLKNIYSMETC